jgi:putative phosphoesterase
MDFLIFSDSHGNTERMQRAIDRQPKPPLAIFYLGDGIRDTERLRLGGIPLYGVRGNCDLFFGGDCDEFPMERITRIGDLKVLLSHGAVYGVKSDLRRMLASAVRQDVDIVLYGHTHTPRLDTFPAGTEVCGESLSRPLYVFNPGSIGNGGSFGTLTVQGENVLFGHGICK